MERLGVKQAHQKIEGLVVVGDDGIKGALLLSQGVEVHIIVVGDGLDLGQVEWSQADSGGHENAFCCFASRQFEYLILPYRHAVRVFLFHGLEQQVQGGDILLVLLLDLRVFQYPHDHGEVLLIFRGLLKQHEDDGLQQCSLGFRPEWI